MPYLDSWDSFQTQAETLYRSRPLHTRYVLKYRHCDGRLVLKVTDDVVVSLLADQIRRFETLITCMQSTVR